MSKKCNKVKNACKICLGAVTQKTGLQCQGACQCWVHYACLNYTPGKIKDIKAGIIRVTCPCPDCKTSQPKEFRTDTPYSCNNAMCPANVPPKCENQKCPINDPKINSKAPGTGVPPCALGKCGKSDCKQYSTPRSADGAAPLSAPKPCKPDPCDANPILPKCPSGCSNDMAGDFGMFQSRMAGGGVGRGGNDLTTMRVVEQMCNTVGELTNQIQQLMMQMKQTANDMSGAGPPHQAPPQICPTPQGSKAVCPKPCFCPGNPGRR